MFLAHVSTDLRSKRGGDRGRRGTAGVFEKRKSGVERKERESCVEGENGILTCIKIWVVRNGSSFPLPMTKLI